jgi:hypothetical protein
MNFFTITLHMWFTAFMRIDITHTGKLLPKLIRFELEFVKQKLYEKFKIYGVPNRFDFKTSRRWHIGQ